MEGTKLIEQLTEKVAKYHKLLTEQRSEMGRLQVLVSPSPNAGEWPLLLTGLARPAERGEGLA